MIQDTYNLLAKEGTVLNSPVRFCKPDGTTLILAALRGVVGSNPSETMHQHLVTVVLLDVRSYSDLMTAAKALKNYLQSVGVEKMTSVVDFLRHE